jgi:hypothetical protein
VARGSEGVSAEAAWRLAAENAAMRQLAARLAERLAAHAFCDTHAEAAAEPDSCPFCADRAAYAAWLDAGGRDYRDPREGAPVDIFDVLRRDT